MSIREAMLKATGNPSPRPELAVVARELRRADPARRLHPVPLAMMAYGSLQRRRRRESAAWANPALVPNLTTSRPGWRRHLPPLLLLLALATLVVALARPQRTVAAPAARGERRDGHGHLGLDERHRRRAGPADRRRRGGEDADREGPVRRSGSGSSRSRTTPSSASRPTTDRAQIKRRARPARRRGRHRDGRRARARAVRRPHAGPERQRHRRAPAAVGDRAAVRRQEHVRQRATRWQVAREAGRARIPIYAIALGTPNGEVELRDSFGFLQRVQVPPDTETIKEVARSARRQVLHGDRDRQGQGDLRQPRHAAVLAQREARGHGGLRRRRAASCCSPRAASRCAGSAGSFRSRTWTA